MTSATVANAPKALNTPLAKGVREATQATQNESARARAMGTRGARTSTTAATATVEAGAPTAAMYLSMMGAPMTSEVARPMP